jgi:hypothetical protein
VYICAFLRLSILLYTYSVNGVVCIHIQRLCMKVLSAHSCMYVFMEECTAKWSHCFFLFPRTKTKRKTACYQPPNVFSTFCFSRIYLHPHKRFGSGFQTQYMLLQFMFMYIHTCIRIYHWYGSAMVRKSTVYVVWYTFISRIPG